MSNLLNSPLKRCQTDEGKAQLQATKWLDLRDITLKGISLAKTINRLYVPLVKWLCGAKESGIKATSGAKL